MNGFGFYDHSFYALRFYSHFTIDKANAIGKVVAIASSLIGLSSLLRKTYGDR